MDEAAETMIKNCHACVLNQSLNKNVPLQPVKLPRGPWIKGAVDIVGPMDGKYILTYIDYYSSYPEAHVLKEITSSEVIRGVSTKRRPKTEDRRAKTEDRRPKTEDRKTKTLTKTLC